AVVCFVDKAGDPTAILELGTAVCGLGRRVPCPWEVVAESRTLIAFAGMRGGVMLIDRRGQRIVELVNEPDYQFPPEYAVCGNTVCVSGLLLGKDVLLYGKLELTKRGVMYRPLKPRR